jgi:NodT family efflux transporter outer membrane factor (OMF) lipoprotein
VQRKLFIALALCLSCAFGCSVGPDFVRPQPPQVDTYTHGTDPVETIPADGQAQYFTQGAGLAEDWWRLFGSPGIDAVIKEAVAGNPGLQAAEARLRQSQDSLRAGFGVFYPQLDAGMSAVRQKFSPTRLGSDAESSIFNLYTLSATISYSLDVFGGNRRAVEGLQAQADFQRYEVLAAHLALTGNIVNTAVAQAAYSAQIAATDEIIGLEREQVRIAEIQAEAGLVPYANVLNIRTQLHAAEATLPPLRQRLSQARHLLATLTGRTPAEWTAPEIDLKEITLPQDLPITLPSELVRRRPDILAAEARLHNDSAAIGVATAALFPDFSLSGSYGLNNTSFKDLFKHSSSFWSLGAGLTAPLFHGGTLWFQRRAAIEGYEASLADYRQSVLSAFAQVADTLRALEHDAEAVHAQSQALAASEQAVRLVQANFEAGLAEYLQVLLTNAQYHRAKIGYLQAHAQRLQDTVALFVALGGGWKEDQMASGNREAGKE